jgi:hypothetical protein
MKVKVLLFASCALLCSGTALAETFAQVLKPTEITNIVESVTKEITAEESSRQGRSVVASQAYLDRAVTLVGQVETDLDSAAARWSLVGLYGVFATHVVRYATEKLRQGSVTLDVLFIDGYMASSLRCGEAPCHTDCEPCNKKCNSCKP